MTDLDIEKGLQEEDSPTAPSDPTWTASPSNTSDTEGGLVQPSQQSPPDSTSNNNNNNNTSLCQHVRQQGQLEYALLRRRKNYTTLIGAILFQYVHSVATNYVYYLHEPADQPLKDLGFDLLPAISGSHQVWSEILFWGLAVMIVAFLFAPFLMTKTNRSVTLQAVRYARVLVVCQALRCITFLCTILPSPNYHCLKGSPDYHPPTSALEIFTRLDTVGGCGDLIFSSHTIFATVGVLMIHHYNPRQNWKQKGYELLAWLLLVILGFLIVAARKHYTVDVIVAWYTCPLVWFYVAQTCPDDTGGMNNNNLTTIVNSTQQQQQQLQQRKDGNTDHQQGGVVVDDCEQPQQQQPQIS